MTVTSSDEGRHAAALAALGHAARLRVVRRLLEAGSTGVVAGRLGRLSGIAPSTLSHHLGVLEREGLIEQRREGRFRRYRVTTGSLRGLLADLQAAWDAAGAPAPPSGGLDPLYD